MPAVVIIRKCFNPDDVWCAVAGAFTVGKGSSLFRAAMVVVEERSISSTSQALGSGILLCSRQIQRGQLAIIVCYNEMHSGRKIKRPTTFVASQRI